MATTAGSSFFMVPALVSIMSARRKKLVSVAQRVAPELPVLLTTGFMDELVRQGSGAFGKDILTKPYRRSELAERVRAALAKQHPDQPPATPGFRHEG